MESLLKPLLETYFCHLRHKFLFSLPKSTFSLQRLLFCIQFLYAQLLFPPIALLSDVLQVDSYYYVPRENEVSTVTCAFSMASIHDIILISVSFNSLLTSFPGLI